MPDRAAELEALADEFMIFGQLPAMPAGCTLLSAEVCPQAPGTVPVYVQFWGRWDGEATLVTHRYIPDGWWPPDDRD